MQPNQSQLTDEAEVLWYTAWEPTSLSSRDGYIIPHFADWFKSIMGRRWPLLRLFYGARCPVSPTCMSTA
jgi:hypothetical protein